MIKKLLAKPNKDRTGFFIPSEYSRVVFQEWLKEFDLFEIIPRKKESKKNRGYLEGAVIPIYCEWQYGVDAKSMTSHSQQRDLFYQDFNFTIFKDRDGNPRRTKKKTSRGQAQELTKKYTDWAEQNGAPIPNPELYKLWRDEWSQDLRFPEFAIFLEFLGIECDAMPSSNVLEKLKVEDNSLEYPTEKIRLKDMKF